MDKSKIRISQLKLERDFVTGFEPYSPCLDAENPAGNKNEPGFRTDLRTIQQCATGNICRNCKLYPCAPDSSYHIWIHRS